MKAYTDIEQSKKLAEILPLESADMCFLNDGTAIKADLVSYRGAKAMWGKYYVEITPAWSLAALLNVLPSSTLDSSDDHYYRVRCMERFTEWYDNAVDACYEVVLKLHEQELL